MTASEELAIIERVRNGETDAFEALVLDNQKKVLQSCPEDDGK